MTPTRRSPKRALRIVTWNCCRGPWEKKRDALNALRADISIIIEAPCGAAEDGLYFPSGPRLGTAVIGSATSHITPLPTRDLPACVNPVAVTGRRSFTLLAVSTWLAPTYKKSLLNGLEAYRDLPAPFIVAGDFNGNPCFDRPRGRQKWADCFNEVEKLGTFSAYHAHSGEAYGSETSPTYFFRWAQDRPFHIDYCFLPAAWRADLKRVEVGDFESWRKLSDHRPLIVDLV